MRVIIIVHIERNHFEKQITSAGAIEIKPADSIRDATDLFGNGAGLTERSNASWLESDDSPFGIYPEKGILPPGESVQCTLRFSPLDVFDYRAYLTCKYDRNCNFRSFHYAFNLI